MASDSVLARTATVVAAAGSALGAVTTIAAAVLARTYRPLPPGVDAALFPAGARTTERWSDWHLYASVMLLVAAAATLICVWLVRRRGGSTVAVVLAAIATAAAGLALWTRPLVRWDQLALEAVTVGTNVSGYWYAAFDKGVRFVLVSNSEVTQTQYATALIAHLAAPALSAVALAAACRINTRHTRRPTTGPA